MLSFTILQIPSKENDYTAIVQATKNLLDTIITDFGVARTESENPDDIEILLAKAKEKALKNVQKQELRTTTQLIPKQPNKPHIGVSPNDTNTTNKWQDEKKYSHSTDKIISEKQMDLIIKLAHYKDEAEKFSKQKFNKNLHSLNQKEANEIIQHFKNP